MFLIIDPLPQIKYTLKSSKVREKESRFSKVLLLRDRMEESEKLSLLERYLSV